MTQRPPPRIAIYLRLSQDAAESTSISRQREACLAAAKSRWPDAPVDVYEDVNISGYKDVVRPEFDRLMARIDTYDALIVYRIDRLTRRGARNLLELVEDRLTPAGCALVSATEPVDTSGPFGELFLVLLAVFAKMESQRLGERTAATKAHLRSAGKWTGGPIPFGYQVVSADDGKTLIPEPTAAACIREVVQQVLAGTPLDQARPPDGPATYQGWKNLLTNPTLAGYRTLRGNIVFDDDGHPLQVWEPIIDPVTFRQLGPVLKQWTKRASRKTLLGGILYCGTCGHTMYGSRKRRGDITHASYLCSSKEGCWRNTIAMETADDAVLGTVAAWLPSLDEQGARARKAPAVDEDRERLETVRAYLDEQMDRLLFDEKRDPSDPAVRKVQERMDRARLEAEKLADTPTGLVGAVRAVLDGRDIRELPLDRQRRLVELVTEKVTILAPSGDGSRYDDRRVVAVPVVE